jgi:hypothetical protein
MRGEICIYFSQSIHPHLRFGRAAVARLVFVRVVAVAIIVRTLVLVAAKHTHAHAAGMSCESTNNRAKQIRGGAENERN